LRCNDLDEAKPRPDTGVWCALPSRPRRKLVLVTREIPLNLFHIRNMETATLAGAVVMPPVPAFYHQPKSTDDLLAQTAGKILDQFPIGHTLFRRWDGTAPAPDDDRAALGV